MAPFETTIPMFTRLNSFIPRFAETTAGEKKTPIEKKGIISLASLSIPTRQGGTKGGSKGSIKRGVDISVKPNEYLWLEPS